MRLLTQALTVLLALSAVSACQGRSEDTCRSLKLLSASLDATDRLTVLVGPKGDVKGQLIAVELLDSAGMVVFRRNLSSGSAGNLSVDVGFDAKHQPALAAALKGTTRARVLYYDVSAQGGRCAQTTTPAPVIRSGR